MQPGSSRGSWAGSSPHSSRLLRADQGDAAAQEEAVQAGARMPRCAARPTRLAAPVDGGGDTPPGGGDPGLGAASLIRGFGGGEEP